jgi:hypothetical protein
MSGPGLILAVLSERAEGAWKIRIQTVQKVDGSRTVEKMLDSPVRPARHPIQSPLTVLIHPQSPIFQVVRVPMRPR